VEMGKHIHAVFEDLPGPEPHLAAWLAAWMGEPEPSTLDQEIDSLTSAEVVGAPSLRPPEPTAPSPPPEPTAPAQSTPGVAEAGPASPAIDPTRLPLAARLSVSGGRDSAPRSVDPFDMSVNRPLLSPERAAIRAVTLEEEPPGPAQDPAQRPSKIQPGRLTQSTAAHRGKRRSGFRFEHAVLAFAFVGLLFAVVYLSANDWKLPGISSEKPPDLLDVDREEETTGGTPAAAAQPSTRASQPPAQHSADLGLGDDIDGDGRLQRCMKKHQRQHDTFEPVEVRYTVLADGTVDGVVLADAGRVDPDLGDCLVTRMRKLRFHGKDIDGPVAQTHVFRPAE